MTVRPSTLVASTCGMCLFESSFFDTPHRKKACEDRERERRNRENYDIQPDVSPAYYRVGVWRHSLVCLPLLGPCHWWTRQNGCWYRRERVVWRLWLWRLWLRLCCRSCPCSSNCFFWWFWCCPSQVLPWVSLFQEIFTHFVRCGAANSGGKFCGECGYRF